MFSRLLTIILFLLVLISSNATAMGMTGTWEYHGPAESGKWLKTEQRGNKVRFQLELQRGAPSFNSGWIEGEFELREKSGTFQKNIYGGLCELTFRFFSNRVEINQSGSDSDCGFGYNVWADGVLKRKGRNVPNFSNSDPRTGGE